MLSLDEPEPKVDDDVHLPSEEPPVARIGDVWICGCHRIAVGDARDPLVYERLMGDERARLVFTDPPFDCKIANNVSCLGKIKHVDFVMGAGETSLPEFAMTILRPAFKLIARYAMPGCVAFVCCDWRSAPHFLARRRACSTRSRT